VKIIHVTTHAGNGGDWQIIKHLTECIRKRGVSVEICGAAVTGKDGSTIELPLNRGFSGLIKSVARFPKDRLPDIFHAHSTAGIVFCIMVCVCSFSMRPILYTHHIDYKNSKIKRIFKIILYKSIWGVHVNSSSSARSFSDQFLFKYDDIKVIFIGVDEGRILPKGERLCPRYRKKLQIKEGAFVFGYVGRVDCEKNVEGLVEAFSEVCSESTFLMIAGDGPLRVELEAMVSKNGLGARVGFVGHIADVENFYRSIDCLVLPSSARETFGLVVVEAALCGVPTLRTNLAGASDQIIDGWSGYICEPDLQSIKQGLKRVLSDRDNLKYVGINARKTMREKFDSARMTDEFIELYENALER